MLLTRKVKVKLKKQDQERLEYQSNLCRILYNSALEQRIIHYRQYRNSLSVYEQKKQLVELKSEFPEYKQVYNKYLSETLFRLNNAFQGFFRRCKDNSNKKGFPRFKGKYYWFTLTVPAMYCKKLSDRKLQLPQGIIVKANEDIPDNFKEINILKQRDKWYVTLTYEVELRTIKSAKQLVAVDLGIKNLITAVDENDNVIQKEHRKPTKKELHRLDNIRSKRDKRKKGSNRWVKYTEVLCRENERWHNKQMDHLHKIAMLLIKQAEMILIGDLYQGQMVSDNRYINRYVQNVWSLGKLNQFLTYKSTLYQKELIKVNEAHTTRRCNKCGNIKEDISLSQRTYRCEICGNIEDRDINACKNIRDKYLLGQSHTQGNLCGVLTKVRNLNIDTYVYV